LSTTLSTRMTGISCTCNGLWLHSCMAVFSKRTIMFCYGSNSTPLSNQNFYEGNLRHYLVPVSAYLDLLTLHRQTWTLTS
jgi:hypothetical protein